jgi:hypothetical protein
LDLTLASLREGVVGLGVEAALPEISAWQGRLAASGDPDLEGAGGRLSRLGALLGSEGDALTDGTTRVLVAKYKAIWPACSVSN